MRLAELRERVAAANVAIDRARLVTLSFGNVSGVDRAEGVLVIKPSGVPYDRLTAPDMVVVALEDGRVVDGALRPSTDTQTHRRLYLEFPAIEGVVHTHSSVATAWAQARRPIPCLGTTHADYFDGPVPVSGQLAAAQIGGDYEWETGGIIVDTVRASGRAPDACAAVLVGNHGPFCWGSSPEGAVETAIALEAIATMAAATVALDAEPAELDPVLRARHFSRKHGPGAYYGQAVARDRW